MRKNVILLLCALIASAYVPAFANGGPGAGVSLLVGGNVDFVNISDIFVERENLNIKVSPYYTVVTAEYTLKNTAAEREISYIFPVSHYLFTYYDDAEINDIAFYDNGKKLDFSLAEREEYVPLSDTEDAVKIVDPAFVKALSGEEIYYYGIENKHYFTKLHFAKGETKTLTVTYKVENSYTSWGTSESLLNSYSKSVFLYDLHPAAYWGNGKAAEFNLRVDYTELKAARDIKINLGDFKRDESGVFTYSAKDFSFADAGIFSVIIDYPFEYLTYTTEREWVKRVYASSTLPGKKDRYSAKNMFDGNIETVWASDGNKGNGIGTVIEIEFRDAQHYESPLFGIVNGFVKNKQLYYENSRIKKLRVESRHYGRHQVKEIEIEDIPYEKISKDVPLMNSIQFPLKSDFVRLTILDVYPGSKYKDVCISEIYWGHQSGSKCEVSDEPFIGNKMSEPAQP